VEDAGGVGGGDDDDFGGCDDGCLMGRLVLARGAGVWIIVRLM
jgi:hypothetical protein